MADASLEWGGDFTIAANGDLLLTDGADMTRQRIIRRLFTGVGRYIWELNYGAGLLQRIGRVAVAANIQAIVRANIALEATVASVPVPTTTVVEDSSNPGVFVISITYTDAITGASVAISQEFPST